MAPKGRKKPEVGSQLFEIIWVTFLVKTTDDDTLERQLDNQDIVFVTAERQRPGKELCIMQLTFMERWQKLPNRVPAYPKGANARLFLGSLRARGFYIRLSWGPGDWIEHVCNFHPFTQACRRETISLFRKQFLQSGNHSFTEVELIF